MLSCLLLINSRKEECLFPARRKRLPTTSSTSSTDDLNIEYMVNVCPVGFVALPCFSKVAWGFQCNVHVVRTLCKKSATLVSLALGFREGRHYVDSLGVHVTHRRQRLCGHFDSSLLWEA